MKQQNHSFNPAQQKELTVYQTTRRHVSEDSIRRGYHLASSAFRDVCGKPWRTMLSPVW
jgi:hypothetical protein